MMCYHHFNLSMNRSSGFGSTTCNCYAHFKLAFASAPCLKHLTLLHIVTRRPILQKVRHHTGSPHGALSACKHKVSGSLSLPSRGSFHRSLTVLYSIGHMVVFSLTRWSSHIPTGFLVSRRTPDTCAFLTISPTWLLHSFAVLSITIRLSLFLAYQVLYP